MFGPFLDVRTTAACNFSSLIWPHCCAPATWANLLFDPPEPQIIGKTQCFATFLPFRAPGSSFFRDLFGLLSSFFFLLLFSSLLFSDSSHLCFSSVNVVGSLVSKLPSINTTQPFSRITGGIGDVCSGSSGQELLFVDFQRCLFDLGQDMPRRSWHHVSSFKEHESCRWLPAFLNCARYRISVTAPGAKPQCFLRGPRPPPFDLSQPCTKRSVHRCPEEFVGMVIFQRRWQWSIYGWWFTIKTRRLSIAMRNHRRVCLYIYNYKYMYTYLHQFAMY